MNFAVAAKMNTDHTRGGYTCDTPIPSASVSFKPAEFIELTSELPTKATVLVAAFEGWNDAGDSASLAASFLKDQWKGAELGHIEPEEFYDFTTTRPQVELSENRRRRIRWPEITFWTGPIDDERDAIIVVGSEPQLRWRTFSNQIIDIAKRCDVERVVTLGALLAEVPHTRPSPIFGSSDNPEVAERFNLKASTYEGPTGIVGVLNTECALQGLEVLSLWAAVPSYLPGASSPKAARALVTRLTEILDTEVSTTDLDLATVTYERQVGEMVAEDADTAKYVQQLEEDHDDDGAETADLSAADPAAMVADLEQFLRNQQ